MQPIFNMPMESVPRLTTGQPQITKDDLISPYFLSRPNTASKDADGQELKANRSALQSPMAVPLDEMPPVAPPKHEGNGDAKQPPVESDQSGMEGAAASQEDIGAGGKRLSRKPSFWDFFRPPAAEKEGDDATTTATTQAPSDESAAVPAAIDKGRGKQVDDAHTFVITAEPAELEPRRSEDTPAAVGAAERTVRRRSSRMSFNFNWARRARRDTDASMQSREAIDAAIVDTSAVPLRNATMPPPPTPALAASKTPRMPSRTHTTVLDAADMQIDAAHATAALHEQGRQLAHDAVRFAHAAHTIKTVDDLSELRTLAADLEQAYRAQLNRCTMVHTQLEGMHWRLHDVHDENTHLRAQLGRLSEKIAEQQATLDALATTKESDEVIVPVAAAAELEQDVTSASAFITAHDDRGGEHQEQRQDAITSATIMHSPSAVQDNDNDDDDKIVLFSSGPLSSAFPTANEPVVSVS